MPTYKLTYFDFPGRGEIARLIFAVAGKPFEDDRIPFDEWPELKENTPFGTLPLLTVTSDTKKSSFKIAQSQCVARFIARKFGLLGRTEQEQAECEMYMEQAAEILTTATLFLLEKNADKKKEAFETFQSEFMPKNMSFFNAKLANTATGFLVGKHLTAADLMLMSVLDNVFQNDGSYAPKTALAEFALVSAHYEKMKRMPAVVAWNRKHARRI